MTSSKSSPNVKWLEFVKTSEAKRKIRSHISKQSNTETQS